MNDSDSTTRVTVIGAGIVGISCASYLQRDGYDVTVIDRLGPGECASFGNAGAIALGEIIPIARPGIIARVPGWLLDPMAPLALRWSYLPRILPWLLRFARASTQARFERTVAATAALCRLALADYQPLLNAAGIADIVCGDGVLWVYDHLSELEAERTHWALRREHGIRFEEIPGPELPNLDPDIATDFACGVLMQDWHHVGDPYRLVQRLAAHFVAQGGGLQRGDVRQLEVRDGRVRGLVFADGSHQTVERLVVAAGAWSHRLSRQLGSPVPLESERGYHTTLSDPGVRPDRMLVYSAQGFVITPMEMGLRVSGTVELAGLDAPADFARARVLVRKARRVYPGLRDDAPSEWMGHRPTLPDCLPVIDRSPRLANVYYAFGHGHLGLTQGPTTGRAIADLVSGRTPALDLAPYRVDRFQ